MKSSPNMFVIKTNTFARRVPRYSSHILESWNLRLLDPVQQGAGGRGEAFRYIYIYIYSIDVLRYFSPGPCQYPQPTSL